MRTLQLTLVAPIIAIGLLVMTSTSRADTLPDYYPQSFAIFGVLSGIDTRSQIISIDDRGQPYDINIKVHTQNTQFSSLDVLRPGMTVGASLAGAGKPRITEIWVLPKSYRPLLPSAPH